MTIEQKLEKKINTIIQLTGDYPEEIQITKEEYKQLKRETKIKEEIIKFRNVKLKIK